MTALLWGILMAGVLLWLEERLAYLKTRSHPDKQLLPQRLIAGMDRQSIYDQGILALKGFNGTVLLVLVCGGLYILAGMYALINPVLFEPLINLHNRIDDYFSLQSIDIDPAQRRWINMSTLLFAVLLHTVPLLIIGTAFWLCQVYAHGTRLQNPLLWLCGFLFAGSLLNVMHHGLWLGLSGLDVPAFLWKGYGWGMMPVIQALDGVPQGALSAFQQRLYETGVSGALLFYMPALVLLLIYIGNFFAQSGSGGRIAAVAGIIVLGALFCIDALFSYHPVLFAASVSGWCCLSLLSVTRKFGTRKIYRIYQ